MQQILHYNEYYANNNAQLQDFLAQKKYETLFKNIDESVILVLWGDGTMLDAIHKYKEKNIPFLGINFWNKGYLLSEQEAIHETNFIQKEYPLLEIQASNKHETQTFFAVNELDIDASRGTLLELEIEIQGKTTMLLRWDGLIIATPVGSTAYNRSLWGPIIPHEVEAFVLTPKAPNTPLWQGPILLNQNEIIHIKNTGRKHQALLFADGKELYHDNQTDFSISVKKSKHKISFFVGKNYEHIWDTKSLTEQGFRRK